jgi:hypothetical protein
VKKQIVRSGLALACSCLIALIARSVAYGQEVKADYLRGTDFSKYRTYKWLTSSEAPVPILIWEVRHPNQILDAQIKESLDGQLAGKGFTKVESDNADLFIDYDIGVHQERQWNGTGMRDALGWPGGPDTAVGTATSSTINVGTLVVNIYDSAGKKLVWTGFATKEINLSKDQRKNQKSLDKTTQKLLKDFPPRRT